MKTLRFPFLCIVLFALGFMLSLMFARLAHAQAADAGPTTAVVAPATSTIDSLPDASQPMEVVKVVRETRERDGLWAAICVILVVLFRSVSVRVNTMSLLSFMKKGYWPAILAGGLSISGALLEKLTGTGTWMAVLLAMVTFAAALAEGKGVTAAPVPEKK